MSRRVYATELLRSHADGDARSAAIAAERQRCLDSFHAFRPYWRFKNRETGEIRSFETLWPGQRRLADAMGAHPWILALKAGKLGFTELECAFDAWVALRRPNARVHVFSKDLAAAQDLMSYIRFGLARLPPWLRLPIADGRGSDTSRSLRLTVGPDDERTIVCYASSRRVAIDQSASHSHVDELAHMLFAEQTWSSIQTTIAPGGSVRIVTRGAADDDYVATLWEAAQLGVSRIHPVFEPWNARPDRDREWRDREGALLSNEQLLHYLPETPDDALAGADQAIYIEAATWDACHDESLPVLQPGDRTPIVLGVDAAIVGDCAAVVAVTRHPDRSEDPAIRNCRLWSPSDYGGRVNLTDLDRFVRLLCEGGCEREHPRSMPMAGCDPCQQKDYVIPKYNVVHIAYDPYQMEEMAQRWMRDRCAWTK